MSTIDDGATGPTGGRPAGHDDPVASTLARHLCLGFAYHDLRDRRRAIEAFGTVDRHQFQHLTGDEAEAATTAFVDALWAKDRIETPHVSDGTVTDPGGLADADWESVQRHLEKRATVVGMDDAYASRTTEAWRNHKTGGDYWTPTLAAQSHEIEAAIDSAASPDKRRAGRSGFGFLPALYLVGVELHDYRSQYHWSLAVDVMTLYFRGIRRYQTCDC